jgi:DNA-binding NarL/FixJ family response regulator
MATMIELLLVDDHDAFRGFVRTLLSKEADLTVVGEANDGRSAVRLARELEPDVILIDVVMPGMGGIEATGQILASRPGIKVIALSMHAEQGFVDAMLGAGASGYVLKDRVAVELVEAIRAVVAGGVFRGPVPR